LKKGVPIDKIASFKKMKLISEDIDLITAALKESEELLEVSEDGLKVRRKTPLVAPESIFQKTVYAVSRPVCIITMHTAPLLIRHVLVLKKGFPVGEEIDDKAFFDLQEEIGQIFSEFGKVEAVRMRKTDDKPSKFKVKAEATRSYFPVRNGREAYNANKRFHSLF
jgi:lupus La protein